MLFKCPNCNEDFSLAVDKCPCCGYSLKEEPLHDSSIADEEVKRRAREFHIVIIAVLVLINVVFLEILAKKANLETIRSILSWTTSILIIFYILIIIRKSYKEKLRFLEQQRKSLWLIWKLGLGPLLFYFGGRGFVTYKGIGKLEISNIGFLIHLFAVIFGLWLIIRTFVNAKKIASKYLQL